ncbi:MAG: hypothetical protein IJ341_00105 [Bacteroidales bacterium]|nr:hypothetical protein [Bacteroidales bacterium]MBQ7818078.1 hypothetical protein [Bacteroidales bacterium]
MKKNLFLGVLFVTLSVFSLTAQVKKREISEQYRRSSLCMVMLEDPNLDASVAGLVKEAFINNPMPPKYNDHGIDKSICTFSYSDVTVTDADKKAYNALTGKKEQSAIANIAKDYAAEILALDPNKDEAPYVAYKYLQDKEFAKKLMARWWGADNPDNATINTNLLHERVAWNATELEKVAAEEATTGRSPIEYLMDNGGDEIVGNTFVPVTRFRYLSAEDLAAEVVAYAKMAASLIPIPTAQQIAMTAAEGAGMAITARGGYFVYSTTYLYRLRWNEEIFNAINKAPEIEKFNALDCFELDYIGSEKAYCSVAAKKYSQEEAVKKATSRALDKVLSKLEREYEVFRTKTPLATIEPNMTANIGTKECIEEGDKYEILMRQIDPKTQKETYKVIGKIKVDTVGNNMGEDNDDENASTNTFTTFKGKVPKNAAPGMLIRQTKK